MSAIADAASININFADFAVVDPVGKSNIIGSGVAIIGFDFQVGLTNRIALMVTVHLPSPLLPAEFPLELSLLDAAGDLWRFPAPIPGGEGQPLRIAQIVQLDKPIAQIPQTQRDHIGARGQYVFDFGNGMPLTPGENYTWRVRVDGDDSHDHDYPFTVAGLPQGPVVG